jgi:hypothetical protein
LIEVDVVTLRVRVLLSLADVEASAGGAWMRADARHDLHLGDAIVAG